MKIEFNMANEHFNSHDKVLPTFEQSRQSTYYTTMVGGIPGLIF